MLKPSEFLSLQKDPWRKWSLAQQSLSLGTTNQDIATPLQHLATWGWMFLVSRVRFPQGILMVIWSSNAINMSQLMLWSFWEGTLQLGSPIQAWLSWSAFASQGCPLARTGTHLQCSGELCLTTPFCALSTLRDMSTSTSDLHESG